MKDFKFKFDLTDFNKLFPFFILIDDNFKIKYFGESLSKIIPELKQDTLFSEIFFIKRPFNRKPTLEDFNTFLAQLIVIESVQDNTVVLRGQFQLHEGSFLFVGSPWFVSMEDVIKKNLKLNDFAYHDPLIDLLHVLKNQEISNYELSELVKTINDQKKTLLKDKEEINKLSLVASSNKNGVVLTDLKGKIFWSNDAYLNLTGYNKCDVIDKTVLELGFSKIANVDDINKMVESFNKGEIFDCDIYHKKKNEDPFWSRMRGQPIQDSSGNFVEYFVVIENISKEREAIDRLKESEGRLSSLVVNLQTGILLEDEDRKILLVNKKFCNLFGIGISPEAMIGMDCSNSANDSKVFFKNSEYFVARIDEILEKKEVVLNEELELADGRFLERSYIPIILEGIYKGHLWSYNDITIVRNYNESINYEKEKYRSIINNMNIGLVEVDNEDVILLANQRFSEMSGYSLESLIGKSGSEIFLDYNGKEILESQTQNRKEGKSGSYELGIKTKDGKSKQWLVSGGPNYNLKGEIVGSIGLHFDITETKNLEVQREQLLKKLEKQNQQLSEYAQIVSHDLKSPLRSIHSLITWIKEDSDKDFNDKTANYFTLIQEKVEKMDRLIQGILTYSKIDNNDSVKEKIDLNDIVNDIRSVIFIPQFISVTIKNKLPIIYADRFRMQQLFQNLISNAIIHNDKPNGIVEIASKELENHFVFSIRDNGVGIEKKYQKNIFKIFKSFNNNNKNTGIGLSIVKGILENSNDEIWLESEVNKGTTFYFTLQKNQ